MSLHFRRSILGVSAFALTAGLGLAAQAQTAPAAPSDEALVEEVVVTGLRATLQASREIKRNADQVVDSIVAEDIGKFPDNSVASALQRVPGVQVSNGFNNEIQAPIIRGLGDILTTLDGREIFTGVGRGFSFQDLPAEALAGVDVYKSNSADLLEGGVAGVVDMKLQKPFNFKNGVTVATNMRAQRGTVSDKTTWSGGLLVSGRWDTQAGEIGLLGDVSFARNNFARPTSFNCDPRSGTNGPAGAAGVVLPTCVGGVAEDGHNERPQVNFAFQWRPNEELEIYADALYSGYDGRHGSYFIFSDLFAAQNITGVQATNDCFSAPVNGAGFTGVAGTDPVQNLCLGSSATFNNVPGMTSTQAHDSSTDQYVFGGGAKFHRGAFKADLDLSYVRSKNANRTIIVDVGKPIAAVNVIIDDDGHGTTDMPGNPLGSADNFRFANTLFQDITRSFSEQYAVKFDASYDLDRGFIRQLQAGVRYSSREGEFRANAAGGPGAPGGNRNTLVNSVGLPGDFMVESPSTIDQINGGAKWYTPQVDFLLDQTDTLRRIYGGPLGEPAFSPVRNYDAEEKNLAGFVQAKYGFDAGQAAVDGLVGLRVVRTERSLTGTGIVFGGGAGGADLLVPTTRDTTDTKALPNASVRVRPNDALQLRASYAKTMARPFFGDLNPGLSLASPGNENVILTGSGGNPDLKPQISDNFDITAEYYFGDSSYVSIAGYYRDIKDRVAAANSIQEIGGRTYRISQPRNLGQSELKGVEISTQAFFDFLPEGWNGLGVLGNFTYADSTIKTAGDPLEGQPLLGVSKYSYNIGGLYEKYGFTARVVYTWRSGYNESLFAGGTLTGPDFDSQFNKVKSNGRLDFSVAYDVNDQVTVSFDGVNILGGKYYSYFDNKAFPHDIRVDDKFYGASIRARF